MNGCLSCLALEYPTVKFCKIKASEASLSMSFVSMDNEWLFELSSTGVPNSQVLQNQSIRGIAQYVICKYGQWMAV